MHLMIESYTLITGESTYIPENRLFILENRLYFSFLLKSRRYYNKSFFLYNQLPGLYISCKGPLQEIYKPGSVILSLYKFKQTFILPHKREFPKLQDHNGWKLLHLPWSQESLQSILVPQEKCESYQ